jgi:hypothetical protein
MKPARTNPISSAILPDMFAGVLLTLGVGVAVSLALAAVVLVLAVPAAF